MAEPKRLSPEYHEQLSAMPRSKAFLGREFLTWLWYLIDSPEEKEEWLASTKANGKSFDFWIDDKLVLESGHGHAHENVLKGGDPGQSQEASTALATGKTPRELKIGVHVKGMGDFTATLNEADLHPRSLKLPVPESDGEGQSAEATLPIATRLAQTAAFLAVLDKLFAHFIEQRTADDWETELLPKIRGWIRRRQQSSRESDTIH